MPPSGSSAPQENGAGPLAPAQGSGDQREIQCFDTHIQETSKCPGKLAALEEVAGLGEPLNSGFFSGLGGGGRKGNKP